MFRLFLYSIAFLFGTFLLSCSPSGKSGKVVSKAHIPSTKMEMWHNGCKDFVSLNESYIILVEYKGDTIDYLVSKHEYDSIQIDDDFYVK